MTATDLHKTITAVWRIESARLIAAITRRVRDVGIAEELAQDALVAAMEQWPRDGIPDKPAAWLMTAAMRRAIDTVRHGQLVERKHADIAHELQETLDNSAHDVAASDDAIDDDLLRLIFIACHPVLSTEARVALTLRLLGGLTTEEIARAFLVAEPTIAQRIVRAKKTLAEANVPFELPGGDELEVRLSSVLEVIYLIFNEGYSATAGEAWTRPELCEEALRLGRILAAHAPREPEAIALVALMELHASRLRARLGADGEPILLLDQDRSRWDRLLIRRGFVALERAERISPVRGRYTIQAAIAACHAGATQAGDTDWQRIADLYAELMRLEPSPVVELNRAVAVGMASGADAGLRIVDGLIDEPALKSYPLLAGVRGDLLEKVGRRDEACSEFERAAALTTNATQRTLLLKRASDASRR